MYAFSSMKMKPDILKLILVYFTQAYVDSLIYPYFNKDYDKLETPHPNYDLHINGVICVSFYMVHLIVPYLGLENKRKLAKAKLTENPNEPSKAQGEVHILIYMTFMSLVYGAILLALN